MADQPKDDRDESEVGHLRDEVIKRMIATPPEPHKPKKGREPKPAPKE